MHARALRPGFARDGTPPGTGRGDYVNRFSEWFGLPRARACRNARAHAAAARERPSSLTPERRAMPSLSEAPSRSRERLARLVAVRGIVKGCILRFTGIAA